MLNPNYLELVKAQLTQFATQSDFETVLTTAFGTKIDRTKIFQLRQQWLKGDFSLIPPIEVLTNGELGAANGGYAASEDKIFVSSDFISQNQNNSKAITGLLLEEFGHKIDRFFNGDVDSAGDEGDIFSRLVSGETLSAQTLAGLKAEDDTAVIIVDGKVVSIEQQDFIGTPGSDYLYGDSGDDYLSGGAGNDYFSGGAGNDSLYGDDGDDYLSGGAGNDYLSGDSGRDVLSGGTGDDELDGGDGDDILSGWDGNDTLYGGSSRDKLYGGHDDDTLYGGDSGDTLDGGTGADIMLGGTGNDVYTVDNVGDIILENIYEGTADTVNSSITYTLGAYVENLTLTGSGNINGTGNALNNIINGSSGNNTLSGGAGKDTINGGDGNDIINGGDGDDTVDGGNGKDTIYLGAGNDYLNVVSSGDDIFYGGTGDDYIYGSADNETYSGEAGNDTLKGGFGNDTINGGVGNDILDGGFGNDTYVIDGDVDLGTDTIDEFSGTDTIDFRTTTTKAITINLNTITTQTVATGVQLVIPVVSIENVYGGALGDTITGNNLNDTLLGGGGNDTLSGGNGVDTLNGGTGSDKLTGGLGNDNFLFNGGAAITGAVTVASLLGKDTIADFNKLPGHQDKIVLSKSTFTKITTAVGGLTTTNFASFATDAAVLASNSSAAILYSSGTGNIFYNQDGNVVGVGANGGIFATVTGKPAIAVTDFSVVA